MTQHFVKNKKYDIKTPFGWEHFDGVVLTTGSHEMITFETENNKSITVTNEHKLYDTENNKPLIANTLNIGDVLHTTDGTEKIVDIKHQHNDVVYDIFNSETHTINANNIHSFQCDEMAFSKKRVARELWASVFPTLSCLHPDTYVLGQYGYMKIKHYFSGDEVPGEYFKFINEKIYGGIGSKETLSHGYVSPKSDTVKIKTKTGYEIEVTPKHPLCVNTINDMVPANNINYGDRLRCDINMGMFGTAEYKGNQFIDNEGFPEYVMLYDRQSIIHFITDHYKLAKSDIAYYQLKLLFSNLGIIAIIDNGLSIHQSSMDLFNELFNDLNVNVSVSDVTLDIKDYYFYDEVVSIGYGELEVTYDFTVPGSHAFLQNGIMGSNTGGSCIITSTPSDDETLFAEIWSGANKTIDENGEDTDVGVNGFKALKITWDAHPERDESYKKLQIAQYGEEKFRREHELEFISMEETLINPVFLSTYEAIDPIAKSGQIRWYKPLDKSMMYFIAYDPSLGTGRDNSAIVIFEFPTLIQVGEWIHNKSDVPTQLSILKKILDMFRDEGFDEDNVFWSLENNSIGEAPLVLIKHEIGEDEFFGTFMREKKKRNNVRVRGGFYTDHPSKMSACSRFKVWFENGKLTVMSKPLLAELKGFMRSGRTYKARSGDTDDIVMATLLIVRMVEIIMKDEEDYLEELGVTATNLFNNDDDDDAEGWRQPMPML